MIAQHVFFPPCFIDAVTMQYTANTGPMPYPWRTFGVAMALITLILGLGLLLFYAYCQWSKKSRELKEKGKEIQKLEKLLQKKHELKIIKNKELADLKEELKDLRSVVSSLKTAQQQESLDKRNMIETLNHRLMDEKQARNELERAKTAEVTKLKKTLVTTTKEMEEKVESLKIQLKNKETEKESKIFSLEASVKDLEEKLKTKEEATPKVKSWAEEAAEDNEWMEEKEEKVKQPIKTQYEITSFLKKIRKEVDEKRRLEDLMKKQKVNTYRR